MNPILRSVVLVAWVFTALVIWSIVAIEAVVTGSFVSLGFLAVATAWIGLATDAGIKEVWRIKW